MDEPNTVVRTEMNVRFYFLINKDLSYFSNNFLIQKGNLTHNGVWTAEGAISRKPDGPQ